VENQRVSLFRQKNRWGLTALSIVLCLVLSPVLGITVFLPQTVALLPLLLMLLLGYVGPVSAAACAAVLIGLCAMLFGLWGSVCVSLLIVPALAVSAYVADHDYPFWQAVAAGGVTMFAGMFAAVALLTMLAGSDVVSALTGLMKQGLDASGPMGDAMLGMMVQAGLIASPEGVEIASNGLVTVDPAVREELFKSILLLMDSALRLEMPMQMATGAVAAGLLGQAVLRKGLLRRGVKVEYPRMHTWRVPKGWGRILGGTLFALYLLAQLVPRSMNTMFYVFSGVFDQVFSLQGIAAMCYMFHKHGKSHKWQAVVFVIGYFFLGTAAVVLGIGDQIADFSRRREELDKLENPFDPRHGA